MELDCTEQKVNKYKCLLIIVHLIIDLYVYAYIMVLCIYLDLWLCVLVLTVERSIKNLKE